MGCVAIITGYLFSQLQIGAEAGLSFLQNLAAERVWSHINLGKNAETLAQEVAQLTQLRDDLVRQVEREERWPRMRRTHQVAAWIERVDALKLQVGNFQASFEGRRTCLEGCSFGILYSNYELGQKAAYLLGQVGGLKGQRGSLVGELAVEEPPDAVVAVPSSSSTKIVGGEKVRSVIRSYLEDDGVGVIGVYGMGGVGKTTYLAEINNNFLEAWTNSFEVVIWVTVSRDVNVFKIQEDIGVRLGIARQGLPLDGSDRRVTLYQALSRKKFMLLLDDVWEKVDLEEIGIPRPPKNHIEGKVVFTTRSKEVCIKMEAHRMVKVNFLDEDESWELFCSKVGEEVDLKNTSASLQPLAKTVVRRCGGLPLALVTVGHAMSRATTIREWEDAIAMLTESPHEAWDMEKEVLSILKFSYDKLENDSIRQCFLYCALYPEDYDINTNQLIDYWVAEGFLDTNLSRGLDRARRRGRQVIERLKAACLLENAWVWNGLDYLVGVDFVKMHDVVRDMALWLTNGEQDDERNVFMGNCNAEGAVQVQSIDRWERAKRISLRPKFKVDVKPPVRVPTCPHLQTLLVGNINMRTTIYLNEVAFNYMPAIRVLDLSYTSIDELPKDISSLVELRYLSLEGTRIRSLPRELRFLVKLRHLDLRYTKALERIPDQAILKLQELQMLNLFSSNYHVPWEILTETGADDDKEITLRGMECSLNWLEELGIGIQSSESLEKLVASDKLMKCIRFLKVSDVLDLKASHLSKVLERLAGLRELTLFSCPGLEELRFTGGSQLQWLEHLVLHGLGQARILVPLPRHHLLQRLCVLNIEKSHGFKDLTWIQHLPCLEKVRLTDCEGLEELLRAERREEGLEDNTFPNLKRMELNSLPRLKIISEHPLLLPSLEELFVMTCPKLKKLPLEIHSATKLCLICGQQEWWDELEWDQDNGIKDIFLGRFQTFASFMDSFFSS